MKEHISFYVNNKNDAEFLKKVGNKSEWWRGMLHRIATGEIDKSAFTTKQQIEIAKLEKIILQSNLLKQKIRIEKSFADYVEIYIDQFGVIPSKKGLKALGSRAISTAKPPTLQKIKYLPKFNYNKSYGTWFGMCKICPKSNFSANTETGIIEKLEHHIENDHLEEAYDQMKN